MFVPVILSDGTLRELLGSGRILLDPYDPSLVQPASVDVRLGTEFRVMRNSRNLERAARRGGTIEAA